MPICIYIYVHIIYVYIYMNIYRYSYICMNMHIYIHVRKDAHVHAYTQKYPFIWRRLCGSCAGGIHQRHFSQTREIATQCSLWAFNVEAARQPLFCGTVDHFNCQNCQVLAVMCFVKQQAMPAL